MELLRIISSIAGVLLAMGIICTSVFLLLFGILFLDKNKGDYIIYPRKTAATAFLSFGCILIFSLCFAVFILQYGPLICHLLEQIF